MNKKLIAMSTAAVALTSGAFAESHVPATMNYYVGAGITYPANLTDNLNKYDTDATSTVTARGDNHSLNSKDVGGEVFAGVEVTHHFGFEGGFSYVGNSTYGVSSYATDQTVGLFQNGTGNLKQTDQWNLHLYGTARLPIWDWFAPYVFGGMGYFQAKGSQTVYTLNTAGARTGAQNVANWKNQAFALMGGAGVQFDFDQFAIRGSLTHIGPFNARNNVITTTNRAATATFANPAPSDYLSLDVLYRFAA